MPPDVFPLWSAFPAMTSDKSLRQRVLFSGNVQGVGFRYTAHRIAQSFAVTGFVRNLADGRVELVVEGAPQTIAAFLAKVTQTMSRYIRNVETADQQPTGEWKSFSIDH
jgi:acylphosphatase